LKPCPAIGRGSRDGRTGNISVSRSVTILGKGGIKEVNKHCIQPVIQTKQRGGRERRPDPRLEGLSPRIFHLLCLIRGSNGRVRDLGERTSPTIGQDVQRQN